MLENDFSVPLDRVGVEFDKFTGRDKLTFACVDQKTTDFLVRLKILKRNSDGFSLTFGIDDSLLAGDCCIAAYLKGAFLGGGSCTLPDESSYSRTG